MSESNLPPKPAAPGAGDPQMDDILASIRRILNEDEAGNSGAPSLPPLPVGMAAPAPMAAPMPAPEPLELTEAMMVQPPAPAEHAPPPEASPAVPPAEPAAPALSTETLVAPAVAAATTAAIGQLIRTVAQERSVLITKGGPTIEDVVREAVRPLLKDWLDQHLGPMVERLVRAEIERVVGRALP